MAKMNGGDDFLVVPVAKDNAETELLVIGITNNMGVKL